MLHTPSPGVRAGAARGPGETVLAPGIAHRRGPVPAGPRQLHGAADGPGREPERPQPPPAGRTPSRQKVRPAPFPGIAGVSLAPEPGTVSIVGGRQSGHMRGSLGLPVAGVGTPARRCVVWQPCHHGCAQARPRAPHRRPRAGPLVAWTTSRLKVSAPVTQCTSLLETQTSKSDWPHLGHSVPGAARARKHGQGVWCPVMGMASEELVGCWPGHPVRGFQVDWGPGGPQRQGRTHRRSRRRSRNSEQVRTSVCQCLGGSCRPRAHSCDAGLQGRTRAQRHLCQL